MNDERAQLQKLGEKLSTEQTTLSAVFCTYCGRVYIIDDKHGRETCDCGKELHPVAKTVTLGQRLECGDGHIVRAFPGSHPRLEIDIDGYVDAKGIKYIGKATKGQDGKWVCLANVAGTLCQVEVTIEPKEIRT